MDSFLPASDVRLRRPAPPDDEREPDRNGTGREAAPRASGALARKAGASSPLRRPAPGAVRPASEPPPDGLPPEVALLFPYPPRPGQARAAAAVRQAAVEGRPLLLEAGTGTGKTAAVLAGALSAAREHGARVLYLTRTNSQQRQAMQELRRIQETSGHPVRAVALQGRTHLCPKLAASEEFRGATAEELARSCGDLKERTRLLLPGDWVAFRPAAADGSGSEGAALSAGHGPIREGEPASPQARTPVGTQRRAEGRAPPSAAGAEAPPTGGAEERPHRSPGPAAADLARVLPVIRESGCEYFAGLAAALADGALEAAFRDLPSSEEAGAALPARGICPYEAAKSRLPDAEVVVAPYVYFFDPGLRRALLSWLGSHPSELVVCCDEAHNLPDHLRDLGSVPLTLETLKRARVEAREVGNPDVASGLPALLVLEELTLAMEALVEEHCAEEDALLPPGALEGELLSRLKAPSPRLRLAAEGLRELGEAVRAKRRAARRLPRSYLHSVGSFLSVWLRPESDLHLQLAARGPSARLELFLLDPSAVAAPLLETRASIHFSATLRPMEQYRDLLGLPPTALELAVGSPFDPARREVFLVRGVTTRYEDLQRDPRMVDRLAGVVEELAATPGANAAVFFPSYLLLRQFLDAGLRHSVGRRVFVEEQGGPQAELMRALRLFAEEGARAAAGGRGALLVAAMGGRSAEGMDFPGTALEVAILVGLPYAKPTARSRALVHYYDAKCGKGWEYAVEAPARRRYLQSLGRLIRSGTDRGIAFLLDDRARRWAPDLGEVRVVEAADAPLILRRWIARARGAHEDRGWAP